VTFDGTHDNVVGNVPALTVSYNGCTPFNPSNTNAVVVTTTREGYGELKHRFTGTNLPLGVVGSPSTPAEYLGVTSIGLAKLFKVQGHRWTVTANTFVGDIAKIGADESALATENANVHNAHEAEKSWGLFRGL